MLDQDDRAGTQSAILNGNAGGAAEAAVGLCQRVIDTSREAVARREQIFADLDDILETADEQLVERILSDPRFTAIRDDVYRVRADYEYEREYILAEDIIRTNDESPVDDFRSAGWYEQATDFEMAALKDYTINRMLFVGAGPYPTSPLSYMRAVPGLRVSCLDRSERAGGVAQKVARIFGFDGLDVINADILGFTEYGQFDCVMIGLVVGTTAEDKETIVSHLKQHVPDSTLLTFRTAVGSGRVIYPTVDLGVFDDRGYSILPDPPHKSFSMAIIKPASSRT